MEREERGFDQQITTPLSIEEEDGLLKVQKRLQDTLKDKSTKYLKWIMISLSVILLLIVLQQNMNLFATGIVENICISNQLKTVDLGDSTKLEHIQTPGVGVIINNSEDINKVYRLATDIYETTQWREGANIYYAISNPLLLILIAKKIGQKGNVYVYVENQMNKQLLQRNIIANNISSNVQFTHKLYSSSIPFDFIIEEDLQSTTHGVDNRTVRIQIITHERVMQIDNSSSSSFKIYEINRKTACMPAQLTLLTQTNQTKLNALPYMLIGQQSPSIDMSYKQNPHHRLIMPLNQKYSVEQTIYEKIALVRRREDTDTLHAIPYSDALYYQKAFAYIRDNLDVRSIYFDSNDPYLFVQAAALLQTISKPTPPLIVAASPYIDVQLMAVNAKINRFSPIFQKQLHQVEPNLVISMDLQRVVKMRRKDDSPLSFLIALDKQSQLPAQAVVDKQYEIFLFNQSLLPKKISSNQLQKGLYLIKAQHAQIL